MNVDELKVLKHLIKSKIALIRNDIDEKKINGGCRILDSGFDNCQCDKCQIESMDVDQFFTESLIKVSVYEKNGNIQSPHAYVLEYGIREVPCRNPGI